MQALNKVRKATKASKLEILILVLFAAGLAGCATTSTSGGIGYGIGTFSYIPSSGAPSDMGVSGVKDVKIFVGPVADRRGVEEKYVASYSMYRLELEEPVAKSTRDTMISGLQQLGMKIVSDRKQADAFVEAEVVRIDTRVKPKGSGFAADSSFTLRVKLRVNTTQQILWQGEVMGRESQEPRFMWAAGVGTATSRSLSKAIEQLARTAAFVDGLALISSGGPQMAQQFQPARPIAMQGQYAARPQATSSSQLTQTRPTQMPAVDLQSYPHPGVSFGNYHALIIGNNRYQHLQGLESAVPDAQRLEMILRTSYGFRTKLLIDAGRREILSELNNYRKTLAPSDNLLIYYAGHGWVDNEADEGYWLPVDALPDNPVDLVSNTSLTATIRAMQAKHVLVVADSCFSGKLTRGVKPQIRSNNYLLKMAGKRARTALTSGGLEPVIDSGGTDGHSVFASALFGALEENKAVIDTSQMFNYIRRQVALKADQFPEYGDIRRAGHDGGDFIFVRHK